MNREEKKAMELSAELWNQFRQLPELHQDDIHEFRFHIHAIQNMIMARPEQRKQIKMLKKLHEKRPDRTEK